MIKKSKLKIATAISAIGIICTTTSASAMYRVSSGFGSSGGGVYSFFYRTSGGSSTLQVVNLGGGTKTLPSGAIVSSSGPIGGQTPASLLLAMRGGNTGIGNSKFSSGIYGPGYGPRYSSGMTYIIR